MPQKKKFCLHFYKAIKKKKIFNFARCWLLQNFQCYLNNKFVSIRVFLKREHRYARIWYYQIEWIIDENKVAILSLLRLGFPSY